MEQFKAWLELEKANHVPKGPMGKAISYALNQWVPLTRFLDDARIPVDNNRSEGALRVVALGRKNFLHFGNDKAGENFAILYSLVSSCQANGVNPLEYLKDVLIRIQTHPASRIDDLLPHNWKPTDPDRPGGDEPSNDDAPPAEPAVDVTREPENQPSQSQAATPSPPHKRRSSRQLTRAPSTPNRRVETSRWMPPAIPIPQRPMLK